MAQQKRENSGIDLSTLIRVNNNGININYFKNPNAMTLFVCNNCNNVCYKASVLKCSSNHDDDDIDSFCESCLNKLIEQNDGKCIIDNHPNPTIGAIKMYRKQISKQSILCPYSIEYRQKSTNNGYSWC